MDSDSEGLKYSGVDLLVVIDNSVVKGHERENLATGLFTLMNALASSDAESEPPQPAVQNLRVAVISSNLGFQYGVNRSLEGFPFGLNLSSCVGGMTEDSKREWQAALRCPVDRSGASMGKGSVLRDGVVKVENANPPRVNRRT